MKLKIYFIVMFAVIAGMSCKKEYRNPNAPAEDDVFSSKEGMIRLIVGIKNRYAVNNLGTSSLYSAISASALSTKEVAVLNAGNADLAQLENGGANVAPNNGVITSLWTTSNIVSGEAQKLIINSEKIPEADVKNAVKIYAYLYKALALGTMAAFWEQVPITTGENATFKPRAEVLQESVRLLDEAFVMLNAMPIPSAVASQIGTEIDVRNTLLALSARYNMMLGNNDAAIAKASAVDLTKKSVYFFNNTNPNPVFRSALTTNNVYGIRTNFGLSGALAPDPNDKRIAFHLTKVAANGSGFFQNDATAIPIYLPGEMFLIRAEAYARKNDLPNAKRFLDSVLLKKPSTDIYGLGADLPAYAGPLTQDALLQEIFKNRAIELYMTGMKLEDSRRFDRPGPASATPERSRNFYPYPQQERDGNSNTPGDPQI